MTYRDSHLTIPSYIASLFPSHVIYIYICISPRIITYHVLHYLVFLQPTRIRMAASHLTSLLLGRSRSVKNGVLSYKVAAAGEKGTLCLRLQIAREQQRQGCYSILQHTVLISVFQACANICEYHMYFCVCARVCPNMRCRLQRNGCAQIALLSCRFLEMVQRCVVLFPVSRISFGAGKLVGSVLTSVVFCKFYWNACVNAGACCSCVRHRNCCSKLAAVPLCFADRSGAK